MKTKPARERLPQWCKKHNKPFVKFSGTGYCAKVYSSGCPDCVAEIRKTTDAERAKGRGRRQRKPSSVASL